MLTPKAGLVATLAMGAVFTLSACHHERAVVYVPNGPPAAIVETRPASPGNGYVWVPGYHAWNGNAYVWREGRWEQGPNGRHDWVPGHWKHNNHGWYWVDGHWR